MLGSVKQGKRKMTFPHDHFQEQVRAEEHSFASIAIVSIVMIGAAMGSLLIAL